MEKIDKLKWKLVFQAFLISVNVYGTFVNISKNRLEYAGFTAAIGAFCFIGALSLLADMMREKNG